VCNGPNALARAQGAGATGTGRIDFAKDPTNGPFVSESVYAFPTTTKAKEVVKASTNQVKACTTPWQGPESGPGDTWTYTVSQLSFRKVGDQVAAWRQVAIVTCSPPRCSRDVPSPPKPIDEVYVRKGNHVLDVTRAELYTTGDNLSGDIQSHVHSALDRLGKALQQAKRQHTK